MSSRHLARLVAPLFVPFAQQAHAFWDPPYVTPANPTADDVVSVNEHLGVCDAFYSSPGYPQITRNGNHVTVVSAGFHNDPGDDACNLITGTISYALGTFPAGDYSVTYYLRYTNFFGQVLDLDLGVTQFAVVPVPAVAESAPTLTTSGIAVLVMALLALAAGKISNKYSALPIHSSQRRGIRRQMK